MKDIFDLTSDSETETEETKELEKLDFSPLLGWGKRADASLKAADSTCEDEKPQTVNDKESGEAVEAEKADKVNKDEADRDTETVTETEKENAVGEMLAGSVEKVKNKIKDSRLLDPEMLKDVFFGSQGSQSKDGEADGEYSDDVI